MSERAPAVALSRRAAHALAALIDIAHHGRAGPVPLKAFAERHGLPPRHLEAVVQRLVKAGLLTSTRGPRGGYALARERRRIALADIVHAVEEETSREVPHGEVIRAALRPVETAADEILGRLTLEDLVQIADGQGRLDPPGSTDFTI